MKERIPCIITAGSGVPLAEWISSQREIFDGVIRETGAVLFRGFDVTTEHHFSNIAHVWCGSTLNYVYRSTPRTDLGGGVYTATEYSPNLSIPFHNENAYQREWPLRLLFFCMYPAEGGGGQTPLSDIVKVTDRIDPTIKRRFLDKNIMYVRNYRENLDIPWQTVFQTTSKAEVEAFCAEHDIQCEWTSSTSLRTRQVCQSFAVHPVSGARLWFNQAHLFHPSSLDKRSREALREMFEENEFPRNAIYGDGSPIEESILDEVRAAYEEESTQFEWEKGDVLVLDNMRIAHSRTPYKGKRRVLVAMSDSYSPIVK